MVFVDKLSFIIMANAAITSAVVYKYRFPSIIHPGKYFIIIINTFFKRIKILNNKSRSH